jgi:hypothetical protein
MYWSFPASGKCLNSHAPTVHSDVFVLLSVIQGPALSKSCVTAAIVIDVQRKVNKKYKKHPKKSGLIEFIVLLGSKVIILSPKNF